MTDQATNRKPLRIPYLSAWHFKSATPEVITENLQNMTTAAGVKYQTETLLKQHFASSTSGQVFSNDAIITGIVGEPVWLHESHKKTATEKGHAAALLDAYQERGVDLTDSLAGSFCFVVFDTASETLFAGTDKMGRLPLYYAEVNQGLVISTQASSLLAHNAIQTHLQNQGIYDYVYFRMIPSPHSIYSGINKLPAAHSLVFRKGAVDVKNYWQPTFSEQPSGSYAEMGAQLKQVLKNAVKRSYDASLSTGAFLSGGLDSSTVTGLLSEISETQAHAYSIGFSAKGYDEMEYARITAKHFEVKLHEYYVTPEDVVEALPLIAAAYDEPFGNSSALPAYFCAKLAAENGVQRLLAGDGGDELFGGNERYVKQKIFERYRNLPKFLRRGLIEPLVRLLPPNMPLASKAESYLKQANTPLPDRLQSYNFLHRHAASEIFTNDFLQQVDTDSPLLLQRHTYQLPTHASTLNRMLYFDWQYTLSDNDIRKVSNTCSLAGVEVTYPMLDDELVAFSCKIPSHWKIKGNDLRHFYKQSQRGWLPEQTINKSKQGFGLPFGVWMETHKPLQELAYESLLNLKKRPYFRAEFIDHAIDLHRNHHAAYYGELVWILMVLELWMSKHMDVSKKA